jgi:predicted nucleic acid-binding protein
VWALVETVLWFPSSGGRCSSVHGCGSVPAVVELRKDVRDLHHLTGHYPDAGADGLSVSPASLRWEVANHATAGVKRRRLTPERARQRVTDFERVTIRELAVDRRRAVDLGLHFGIYAYDTYILEGTRSSRFPLLALDGPIRRNAKKLGLSLVGAGSMTLYTYSTARPRVAEGWHGRTENPSAAKNRSGFGCTTRTVSAYPSWNRRPDHGRVVSVVGSGAQSPKNPK